MVSIDELNSAASSHSRRVFAVAAAGILTLTAGFAVVAAYRDPIRVYLTADWGATVGEIVTGLTPLPALLVLFGGLLINERWSRRDSRLICPACKKSLLPMKHLVVATRNCGHCGKRVLAEPDFL